MEKYVVNGVEIEYDTFDLDALERRQKELETVDAVCKRPDGDYYSRIRNICNAMLDFFDVVIGPGTAEKLCGSKTNVKIINDAYLSFNAQVNETVKAYHAKMFGNRAERRATQKK